MMRPLLNLYAPQPLAILHYPSKENSLEVLKLSSIK
jgi:hypothetical protein